MVNALSKHLEVWVRRDGKEYKMAFAGGDKVSDLEVIGSVGRNTTGTTVRFWPDPQYFDTPKFSVSRLEHVLRAKAVLCPGPARSASATRAPARSRPGATRTASRTTWSRR